MEHQGKGKAALAICTTYASFSFVVSLTGALFSVDSKDIMPLRRQ
jgi:hypothetical protein